MRKRKREREELQIITTTITAIPLQLLLHVFESEVIERAQNSQSSRGYREAR